MPGEDDFLGDDSFWDIDTLMPKTKRKKEPGARSFAREVAAKERREAPAGAYGERAGRVAAPAREKATAQEKAPESENAPEKKDEARAPGGVPGFSEAPERSYEPAGGAILRVDVYTWPNRYAFFANFRKNALESRRLEAREAEFAPFFSFMPQYHQMSAAVLRYYIWWRRNFEEGRALKTDFSYLLLYAYEIVNLPDVLAPERGAELLARLWEEYRKSYPKIEKYLAEWLVDYCLIHDVRPTEKTMAKIAAAGRQQSTLRAFYLTREETKQPGLLLSAYDYRTSKYRTPENAAYFDLHVPAAMEEFFAEWRNGGEKEQKAPVKTVRTAYDGAVCVYSEKKKLEILCRQAAPAAEASMFVTDAVKYAENCVRAYLGIRARMAAPSLTSPMRRAIDGYFVSHLPSPIVKRSYGDEDYQSKYEPDSRGFSEEEAEKIEKSSLLVAERLGRVFEEEEDALRFPEANGPAGNGSLPEEKEADAFCGTDTENLNALKALIHGGQAAFKKAAAELHLLPESLMERINEEAYERYGDAAIEERDSVFTPIPDYADEIGSWLNEEP